MSVSDLGNEVAILRATIDKQLDKIDDQKSSLQDKDVKIGRLTEQLDLANMEIIFLKRDIAARDRSEPSAKRSR